MKLKLESDVKVKASLNLKIVFNLATKIQENQRKKGAEPDPKSVGTLSIGRTQN
jgi:hypothetical protein